MSRQWKHVFSRSLQGDFHRYMSSRYFLVSRAQDKLLSSQSWVNNGFVFAKVYKYLHTQTVKSTNFSIPKRTSLQISLYTDRQVYKYLHSQTDKSTNISIHRQGEVNEAMTTWISLCTSVTGVSVTWPVRGDVCLYRVFRELRECIPHSCLLLTSTTYCAVGDFKYQMPCVQHNLQHNNTSLDLFRPREKQMYGDLRDPRM